jgi:hypothetical protein
MTKIKLNLHDIFVDALGGETTYIPASVEVSEILDLSDLDTYEQDLGDLLFENQLIAHIWSVQDVKSIRPDLNDDQAWTVLQRIEEVVDRDQGITWDDLERTSYDLFGTGSTQRIERCDRAIVAYNDDLPELNLIDLLADAMHWCQAKGQDFEATLAMARTHCESETPSKKE